jgi:hypothetical protein
MGCFSGCQRDSSSVSYQPLALAGAGVALIVPALIFAARRGRPVLAWFDDLRIVGAGLLTVVPLFLWICGVFSDSRYVSDPRLYEPIRPLAVCIAYFLAAIDEPSSRTVLAVLSRYIGGFYLLAFFLVVGADLGFTFAPTGRGAVRREVVVGAPLRSWPSFRVTYEFSDARRFVLALMKTEPTALLVTNVEHWFYAAPDADRSRIMRWEPCERLKASHISGPARVLIFVTDAGGPSDEVQWSENPTQHPECLTRFPGLRLIRRFPDEQLKVLQAHIPKGLRLPINPVDAK